MNLLSHIDLIHTTELGRKRIIKNLKLNDVDVVSSIKNMILQDRCIVYKNGKNYYCEMEKIRITINASNYCIITAHILSN